MMGAHIAADYAQAGHTVRFTVSRRTGPAQALDRVCGSAPSPEELDITYTEDTEGAASSADLIVEALPEDLSLKRRELGRAQEVSPTAILATNTSSLTIGSVGEMLEDPTRLVGTHYVNPPWAYPLVEVIPSRCTARAVVDEVDQILLSLGRVPIRVSRDVPGFVFNRLQFALLREALELVESGTVTKADLDRIVVDGLGRRWAIVGPLASAGLGGSDLFYELAAGLYPALSVARAPTPTHKKHLAMTETEIIAQRRARDARLAELIRGETQHD
jgi:3-hydroxybutyryl-CoA dehydrogenase